MGRTKFARSQRLDFAIVTLGLGDPTGTITPAKEGELFWDQSGNVLYIAEGTTSADWVLIASSGGSSPSPFTKTDNFTVASDGQTVFTLSDTPASPSETSQMLVNGVSQEYGSHYTISGTTLTFIPANAGFELELSNEFGVPDRVTVHYVV